MISPKIINDIRISYKTIFFILFLLFLCCFFLIIINNTQFSSIIKIITLFILNFYLIWLTWDIPFLLIFSLFIFNYTYVFSIPIFYPSIKISGIGYYYNNVLLLNVLDQYLLGMTLLVVLIRCNYLFFKKNPFLSDTLLNYVERKNNNLFVVSMSYLLSFFFLLLVKVGRQETAFLALPLPFEYIFLFLFFIKIYGKNSRFNKIFIHAICIGIIIKTALYGGRIEIVESLLLLYIFYYEKKIKPFSILVISIFFTIIMEVIAVIRNVNGNNIFNNNIWNSSKIFFDRSHPPQFILGNEGDVIYSGMAMNGLIKDGVVSNLDRLTSFFHMLVTQFFPVGHFFDDANLALYVQNLTPTLGGGIIFSQWFFWLGTIGLVIVSILVFLACKLAYDRKKASTLSIAAIYALIMFPRWFAYFPDYLLKIPFVLFVLLFSCNILLNSKFSIKKFRDL